MYAANVAAVNGANGYGYDHTSAYGGSVAVKGKDLEEQVSRESGLILSRLAEKIIFGVV